MLVATKAFDSKNFGIGGPGTQVMLQQLHESRGQALITVTGVFHMVSFHMTQGLFPYRTGPAGNPIAAVTQASILAAHTKRLRELRTGATDVDHDKLGAQNSVSQDPSSSLRPKVSL